jgi:hypothetical protein
MEKIKWARDELNMALKYWDQSAEGKRSYVEDSVRKTMNKLEDALKQIRS